MRVLVIHNPVSGRRKLIGAGFSCKSLLDRKKISYQWFTTLPQKEQPFHELDFSSFDRVIVIGGDGTVREAVSYMIRSGKHLPLGIVPSGSANLLAWSLGIPVMKPTKALLVGLNGEPTAFDVGVVNNSEYFLVGCGKGHDAMMHKTANRAFKRRLGFMAYVFATIRQVFHFRRLSYTLEIDSKRYRFRARTVLVFNMLNVFGFLKKYKIDPADGKLNVVILQASTFWAIGRGFMKLLHGSANEHKSGLKFLSGKHITITTREKDIPVEIDGEVSDLEKIDVRIKPQAIMLVV